MTPYYDREEWPGFLASIRANPDDDLPRLVAADFLEENGEPERAELIRLDCSRWSRWPDFMRVCEHDRPRAYPDYADLVAIERRIFSIGHKAYPDFRQVTLSVERGFLSRVRAPLAVLIGGACGRCGGRGYDRLPLRCPDCHGTGSTPGVLRELLRREPLRPEGIEVTDMPIFPSSGNSTYYVGGLGRMPREYWGQLDSLPSESAARLALSRAVYAVCSG